MKILILLGAGASVDSGIPCFRGASAGNFNFDFLDLDYIKNDKDIAIQKLKDFQNSFKEKKHNHYHDFITKLEINHNVSIISQNIDNLDNIFSNVLKIHGRIHDNKCYNNYKHSVEGKNAGERCDICNSYVIPDILYYNEKYKKSDVIRIKQLIKENYDFFIIIGSSLDISYIQNIVNNIFSLYYININPELEFTGFDNYKTLNDFLLKNILLG